jgi:hypothetical protein
MKRSPASESGFISFGLIRLIIPIALLWGGGQGLYTALTNRQPHSVTFAEYARTKPDKKWVELKETQLVSEVYIPMHAPGEADDAKVQALLLTKDKEVIDLVKQLRALPNEKAVIEFVAKNHERVFPQRTVSGMVQFGIDSDSKKRRKIEKLDANLAGDFAVIEEGKKPGAIGSFFLFAGAFPAMWLCWFRRSSAPEGIPTGPSGAPPLAPPPLPK